MSSPSRWRDAVLAGLASSMRTFAGPVLLAGRGHQSGRRRVALVLAGVGELVMDKTPVATDRIDPPGLGGRLVAGAYSGHTIAGARGLAAGAVGAGVGTYVSFRARKLVVKATGLPDPMVAVGEDILAYSCAAFATRSIPRTTP